MSLLLLLHGVRCRVTGRLLLLHIVRSLLRLLSLLIPSHRLFPLTLNLALLLR